jgi:hypothetical protein
MHSTSRTGCKCTHHLSESQPQLGLSILPRRPSTSTTCTYDPAVIDSCHATIALSSSLPVSRNTPNDDNLRCQHRQIIRAPINGRSSSGQWQRAFAQDRTQFADELVLTQRHTLY